MRVGLLGPVEIEVGGAAVAVGGPRAQAVLATLAVRAGEVVTADWLIDQLWGPRPPRAARTTLQAYVSRLRVVAGRLLPRLARGYLLDPTVAEIDTRRFVGLSGRSLDAAAEGRWAEALHGAVDAGGLWRGDPFTGIDDVPALTAERERLAELRWENQLTTLRARLELSGPADVIGPAHDLVAARDWDERAWELLMLALYRAGRQTKALEVAARARRLLVDGHGLDPSPTLVRLELSILDHDPALRRPATCPRCRCAVG